MKYLIFTFAIFLLFHLLFSSFFDKKKELNFLSQEHSTILKGIAILLVVLNHLGGVFGLRYFTPLGGIGVSIFLIFSGYGLNESYNKVGLKKYWIKRVQNVFLLYIIIQTLAEIFNFQHKISVKNFLLDILIIKTTHPFGWYLKYLIMWYIIFYIVNIFPINDKTKRSMYLFISLFMLIVFKDSLWAEQSFSFVIGIFLSQNKNTSLKHSKTISIILLFLGVLFLILKQVELIRHLNYIYFNSVQLMIKLPIAIALIFYTFQIKDYVHFGLFLFCGQISYEIYLVHAYSLKILSHVTLLNILIFIVATISLSLIFKYVLKILLYQWGTVCNKFLYCNKLS